MSEITNYINTLNDCFYKTAMAFAKSLTIEEIKNENS